MEGTLYVAPSSLVRTLENLRRLPLDEIPTEQADAVVRHVLTRDTDRVVVDVARFGSSI